MRFAPRSLPLILLAACGGEKAAEPDLAPPASYEQDLGRTEPLAMDIEERLEASIREHNGLEGWRADLDGEAHLELPGSWDEDIDGDLRIHTAGRPRAAVDLEEWCARAEQLAIGSAGVSLDRFWLGSDGVAIGRVQVTARSIDANGRHSSALTFLARFEDGPAWRITRLEFHEGTRLSGPQQPRFVEVTEEVGVTYGISAENRALLSAFVDRQQTLALGGLSVLDFEGDGDLDLLGTRRGQLALLFENDGESGFIPRPLPLEPHQCGSFLLYVDLDGDGKKELVGSEPLGFAGDRAWCGIWRPTENGFELDERALEFQNPPGLRRLSVQTVVPCDVQGDGRLDLFFAVYGTALSRGDDYNTVEAHDGAKNHLFVQQPDGSFVEESIERGIEGTGYSYIACAFDFDFDGDQDLFEGNDFGPNVLWRNDGQGHFTADTELGFDGVPAYTMGATLAEVDGAWNLYVSNMSSDEGQRIVETAPAMGADMRGVVRTIASGNQLYVRDEMSGKWIERAAEHGVAEGGWAWGSFFFDPENDGDLDLVVTNGFTSHSDRTLVDWQSWYWRQVVDDARGLEAGRLSRDVNVDEYRPSSFNGYERDRFYLRAAGSKGYVDAAFLYGIDAAHDGRCVIPFDMDRDGDLDLAYWTLTGLRLFENRGESGHLLTVSLSATEGHPGALGAVVTVQGRRAVMDWTEGFQSQVPAELAFGLGDAEGPFEVAVEWTSGKVETFTVPGPGHVLLTEGGSAQHSIHSAWAARPPLPHGLADQLSGLVSGSSTLFSSTPLEIEGVLSGELPPVEGELPLALLYDSEGSLVRAWRREVSAEDIEPFLHVLTEEAPFPELCVLDGRRALSEGRLRIALSRFEAALASGAPRADAYEGIGRVHMIQERPDLAEPAYFEATQVDPDYALGHYNLGVARMQLGRPEDAIESLQASLSITGDAYPALMALAEAGLVARDTEVALDAWSRAAAISGELEPRLNRAKMLGQMRRYEESAAAFEEVLRRSPGHPEATRALVRLRELLGS